MPLSLEDVMNFMMKDKEERVRERESDKQEIKELITSGVKSEVLAAIQPIQERQLQVENVQGDMVKQFKGMIAEVKEMKQQLKSNSISSSFPNLPEPRQPENRKTRSNFGEQQGLVMSNQQERGSEANDHDGKVQEIINLARRTLGLYKIDRADLDRMRL